MLVLVGASMMAVFATMTSTGAVNHDQRNARTSDERVQLRCAFRGGMPIATWFQDGWFRFLRPPWSWGVNGLILILVAIYFLLVQRRVAML